MIRLEPRHQLRVRDARGVLHGTRAADSHDPIRRFDPRPGYRSALDHLEDEGRLQSYLQRHPTQLTLTLASVSVARVEERALVPDREIDRVAGTDVRHVHVASEGTRRQRADCLEVGGDGQRSHEGVPWQRHSELATAQDISLELPDPDLLLERFLKRPCDRSRGEAAEVRDQAADSKVPGGGDVFDVDGEGIPGLGAIDVDGSGLWIQEFGAGKRPTGDVLLGSDATLERIVAVDHHPLPRTHARNRFTIWAEHIAVRIRHHFNRGRAHHPDHLNLLNGGSAKSIPQKPVVRRRRRHALEIPAGIGWLKKSAAGAQWLSSLTDRVNACVEKWDLRLGSPFTTAYTSLTIPARLPDGADVVLKVPFPDRESEHEALALSWGGGDGAVTVLRARREPWLAIDPKPLAGEREFGLAPIVRSFEFGASRRDVRHRLDRLSSELGLDRERSRLWCLAQTVAWSIRSDYLSSHVDTATWLLEM